MTRSDPDRASGELLRALGAIADNPADARTAGRAIGLPEISAAEHTEAFVLNCPPHASVYLGPEGGLGGEGTDRVAGFWRVIGLVPPREPDHLTTLLSLYAALGEAADQAASAVPGDAVPGDAAAGPPGLADRLGRAREVLFNEHLWPWLPGYLDAVAELGSPGLAAWAALTTRALVAERAVTRSGPLPLALRAAPEPISADTPLADLAAALTTPVRSGLIVTRHRLRDGAGAAGTGYRIGERRFALRSMLEQDPGPMLGWLAGQARGWSRRHAERAPGDPAGTWWSDRAAHTARMLLAAAERATTAVG
ncbi:MAG: molecular chaperone TorD family protein [Streptosporangiaceae bacterium]